MTDECISPLRQRMIEDMSLRHFGEKTQKDYIRAVKNLATFLGCSPDTATAEDLRRFQLHLTETHVRPPSINFTVTALRFFFTVTLDRADAIKHLTFVAEPRKIPVVLSPEEVARFLEAAPGVKYKAAFSVAYGAGLRVFEVASLKVHDIDSERMMLRVDQGKGRKVRHAMLSPVLLELLRDLRITMECAAFTQAVANCDAVFDTVECYAPIEVGGAFCDVCLKSHFPKTSLNKCFWQMTPDVGSGSLVLRKRRLRNRRGRFGGTRPCTIEARAPQWAP